MLMKPNASETKAIAPSEARLRQLLARGFLPAELPPPFTAVDFAAHSVEFAGKWDEKKIFQFWTKPELYSIPRYGHARRGLSIVNPVNQLQVSLIIAKNWQSIRTRLRRSQISEFNPKIIIKGKGRSITGVNFDGVARRKAEILGSYGRYVKTDIARFYPSIYTHAIPWSILGKENVKGKLHDAEFRQSFANRLDAAIRAGQQGQTIGIPVGPDTSRIISELIAVDVEEIARENIKNFNDRAVRFVDDIIIGIDDDETASSVLRGLSTALYEYELEINAEKTLTFGIGSPHAPEWTHYVRNYQLSGREGRQRDDLDSYFEQAIHLADSNPRDNVMLFAVRRAASFSIQKSNLQHLIRWLLYSARRAPSCLSFVAEHLAANHQEMVVSSKEISSFIEKLLPLKAEAAHTEEVAWLLFWAREIETKLPLQIFEKIKLLRSSVVGLITLDLRSRGLIDGVLKVPDWRLIANEDGLKSEMWLMAYEATKKGWWSANVDPKFIAEHAFFGDLWQKSISFYDVDKKAEKKDFSVFSRRNLFDSGFSGYP